MNKRRRYLQGTLDFHCGIYSVINALACLRDVRLQTARTILSESVLALAPYPDLLKAFLRNETDHYWMVAYCLSRWTHIAPFNVQYSQLWGDTWVPEKESSPEDILEGANLYLPEIPITYADKTIEKRHLDRVWNGIADWLRPNLPHKVTRAVIFRFHYYLRGEFTPLVSHWTTAIQVARQQLILHDASGNEQAIHALSYNEMLAVARPGANAIRIVPESVILLNT